MTRTRAAAPTSCLPSPCSLLATASLRPEGVGSGISSRRPGRGLICHRCPARVFQRVAAELTADTPIGSPTTINCIPNTEKATAKEALKGRLPAPNPAQIARCWLARPTGDTARTPQPNGGAARPKNGLQTVSVSRWPANGKCFTGRIPAFLTRREASPSPLRHKASVTFAGETSSEPEQRARNHNRDAHIPVPSQPDFN